MLKLKSVLPLILLATLTHANAMAPANLVTNGGFESNLVSGQYSTFSLLTQGLAGWSVGAGSVDVVSNLLWSPSAGVNSLDLNGSKKGEIHQLLNTVVGQTYELSFDLSGNLFGAPTVKNMSVNVGSDGLYSFDTTGHSTSNMGWNRYTTTFVATSTATTLSFASSVSGNAGPALDNISVTAVPEPGTYAMFLAGLGLIGTIARRRTG